MVRALDQLGIAGRVP